MTKKGGKSLAMARIVALMTLNLCAHAAQAQSVSDYRLPEPTASPTPRAAGPVDPENPGASTPRAISTREPAPATRATTATAGSPAPTPRASALPTATPGRAAPRAVPRIFSRPATVAAPSVPIIATPDAALPDVLPTGATNGPAPSFPSLEPSVAAVPAPDAAAWWWPYLAAGSAALTGLFALLWWRRRGTSLETVVEFEMPVVASPLPEPVPVQPIPELEQAVAPQPDGLALTLEATRLSASLMATTLSYRLKLTNHGAMALAGLAIEGDMVSAHASLPPEQQMAQAGQVLELRHALATLAPGESAEFSGDIRLPLAQITPIRAGELAYFVPLARFRVEAGTPDGATLILARTYVVGDVPEGPQATLRPFRLDLGPRTYSRVSQREVN